MATDPPPSSPGKARYGGTIEDLERDAHVPPEEQVTGRGQVPPPDAVSPDEVETQRMLRHAGGL